MLMNCFLCLFCLVVAIILLILGIKEKKKKRDTCLECGNLLNKSKVCSKCGFPNNYSKMKMLSFLVFSLVLFICCILIVFLEFNLQILGDGSNNVTIHIFYRDNCSYCVGASNYIEKNLSKNATILYHYIDSSDEGELFDKVNSYFNLEGSYPLIVINDRYVVGYDKDEIKKAITDEKARYKNFSLDARKEHDIVENIQLGNLQVEDKRTAKEKMVDYLEKHENATCTDDKCTYTFQISGINNIDYYTVDFENKKFIFENYRDGNSYAEYDFANNSGYSKNIFNSIWTVTTTMDVNFNDEDNTYTWNCNSDLPNYCTSSGSVLSDIIVNLRSSFLNFCNNAGISPADL